MVRHDLMKLWHSGSVSALVVPLTGPVARVVQQLLHQARTTEAVGVDDEGQLVEQVGTRTADACSDRRPGTGPSSRGPAYRL